MKKYIKNQQDIIIRKFAYNWNPLFDIIIRRENKKNASFNKVKTRKYYNEISK